MTVLRRVGAALDQIALSALRAFAAASAGYAVAHATGLVGNTDQLKGLALAAVFAGLHSALHVIAVAAKKDEPVIKLALARQLGIPVPSQHTATGVPSVPVVGVTD